MTKVSIIYFSGTGHTTKLAEAVHKGAAEVPGVEAVIISLSGDDIVKGRYENADVLKKLDDSGFIDKLYAYYGASPK